MKRLVAGIILVIGTFVLLAQASVLSTVVGLLFLGIIPGTTIVIPFWVMFLLYLISGFALLIWLSVQPMYIGSLEKQERTARRLARARVTKKNKARTKRRFREAKV